LTDRSELDKLYRDAQSALKAKDYNHASDLLTQILVVDENYKDVSRLLAQAVKLKRRRWYNDPRVWGGFGFLLLAVLGFFIASRLGGFYAIEPYVTVTTTVTPTVALSQTPIVFGVETPLPAATAIPLTWKRIYSGDQIRHASVTSIVVDPHDPDVIYAGTNGAGIYKSIDGGTSWRPAHNGLKFAKVISIVVDPDEPRILHAATQAGIYKTVDGGENWEAGNLDTGNNGVGVIALDPTNPMHLFYTPGGGIYQSNDGGETWDQPLNGSCPGGITDMVLDPKDPKTLFINVDDGSKAGIYTSHDGGVNCELLYETDQPTSQLVIDNQTGDNIYAKVFTVNSNGGIYGSYDGGVKWQSLTKINCQTLSIHPQDGKFLLCGTIDGAVYRSTDGGQNWSLLVAHIGRVESIAFSPVDSNTILVGANGIYLSRDGGKTWEERNNGLGNRTFDFGASQVDNSTYYLMDGSRASGDWVIYNSQDQGKTWKTSDVDDCSYEFDTFGAIHCVKKGNAINSLGWSLGSISANPYRHGELYGIQNGEVKISYNSGLEWHKTSGTGNFYDTRFFFSRDQKTIYVASAPSIIMKSTDGVSWESCGEIPINISSFVSRFAIDPNDDSHVYAATIGEGVYTSRDGCKSWAQVDVSNGNRFVNSVATDSRDSNLVYAGTDSGAYISTDGGTTWGQVNDGLLGATVVYSISVDKDSNVYAATPYGIFKLEKK
jgi:photosystem II stability/assembly factor-like uncharacterized protein